MRPIHIIIMYAKRVEGEFLIQMSFCEAYFTAADPTFCILICTYVWGRVHKMYAVQQGSEVKYVLLAYAIIIWMGLNVTFCRLTIERLENEKKELLHELQSLRRNGGGGGGTETSRMVSVYLDFAGSNPPRKFCFHLGSL